jgi:PAS domain S-box-containing protein
MRAGASDYMPKDKISSDSISRSILHSMESYHLIMRAKQAEINLSENEKRYRTIVETVSDFIFELNPDGEIIFANSAFKMIGYEREELIGQHIKEFLVADDLEDVVDQVATQGVGPLATTNLEVMFKTNEDSTIFGEMGSTKMFLDAFGVWDVPAEMAFKKNINKKFLGTVCIGRDIPTSDMDLF